MMLYLAGSEITDIAYAVNQCAHFSHNPERNHKVVALKHIDRYLKGARDKGLITITDCKILQLDLYVDTDFAVLFVMEDKHDPVSMKSQTKHINFGGAPFFWNYKLQSEIPLSTLETVYIALSQERAIGSKKYSPRTELANKSAIEMNLVGFIAWEDNIGTQNLANSKGHLTSMTKHIGIKYHWSRSKLIPNEIGVQHIGTDDQRADIITKGSIRFPFEQKRKLVMNW